MTFIMSINEDTVQNDLHIEAILEEASLFFIREEVKKVARLMSIDEQYSNLSQVQIYDSALKYVLKSQTTKNVTDP